MRTSDALSHQWNRLRPFDSAYQRIDAEHPLAWHLGFEERHQRSLLLLTQTDPGAFPSSKGITVAIGERSDGQWAVSFRLAAQELDELYLLLCDDLIESSRTQRNNPEGLQFVQHRYQSWLALLEHQGPGLLSDAQRRGLLGELLYIERRLSSGMSSWDAVAGWLGPTGSDQDFVYSDGWHEVKAVAVGRDTVMISSVEQLDGPLPGELVLVDVEVTTPLDPTGTTLHRMVDIVRRAIEPDLAAAQLLRDRLLQYGYIDLPEYDQSWYRVGPYRRYRIDEKFPRLTRQVVPAPVTSVRYALSIPSLAPWREA